MTKIIDAMLQLILQTVPLTSHYADFESVPTLLLSYTMLYKYHAGKRCRDSGLEEVHSTS